MTPEAELGLPDPMAVPEDAISPSLPAVADQIAPTRAVAPLGRRRVWRRLRRNPAAMIALGYLLLLLVVAVFADLIMRYPPEELHSADRFASPSRAYWLGADDLGRDIFSRLVDGTRVSLRASFQVVAVSLALALPLGLSAGYFGGRADTIVMRCMDALMSIPALVLALAIAGVMGPGLGNVLIALSIVITPSLVRLTRAQTLAVREETFVAASRTIGTPTPRLLRTRILPNAAAPIIVAASLYLGVVLLAEAALSFLGLGQAPPAASWGSMLRRGFDFILVEPWQMVPPGLAIAFTVLAFNTIGDGLLDAVGMDRGTGRRQRRRDGLTAVVAPAGATEAVAGAEAASVPPTATAAPLLSVRDLSVEFTTDGRTTTVVDRVTFDVQPGEVVAIVGESGSGKTVTTHAVMRLIPSPPGRISSGVVELEGRDLLRAGLSELRKVRGDSVALIPQDPMASFNPAFTIGDQVIEAIRLHRSMSKSQARARAQSLLTSVGIPDAARRLRDYPHQFSGGMRQRAMIAMALACDPVLLLADEPTTALDVTVQAQIIELLKSLRDERQMAIVFVTHDLGVVADLADRVVVMYAGQIVEQAPVGQLFARPEHPYTERLLAASPHRATRGEQLVAIPGRVPPLDDLPPGCRFRPRCEHAIDACAQEQALRTTSVETEVRCCRAGALVLEGSR